MTEVPAGADWPLFPLQTVLFPEGRLDLQVFEARYLDLISGCLRSQTPFGVVAILAGHEVRVRGETPELARLGTLAAIDKVDAPAPPHLSIQAHGTRRFRFDHLAEGSNGLWIACGVVPLPMDAHAPVPIDLQPCVRMLKDAIEALAAHDQHPFAEPFAFDDAGWVANRWAELLPLPADRRLALLAMDSPLERLRALAKRLHADHIIG